MSRMTNMVNLLDRCLPSSAGGRRSLNWAAPVPPFVVVFAAGHMVALRFEGGLLMRMSLFVVDRKILLVGWCIRV